MKDLGDPLPLPLLHQGQHARQPPHLSGSIFDASLQGFQGGPPVMDVGGRAEPLVYRSTLVPNGLRPGQEPPVDAVVPPDPMFPLEGLSRLRGSLVGGPGGFPVGRMEHFDPAPSVGPGLTRILRPTMVVPGGGAFGVAPPEKVGDQVHHRPESRLALPECPLGQGAIGDVDADAHLTFVRQLEVRPTRFQDRPVLGRQPEVPPPLVQGIHETAHFPAVRRIRIARLHDVEFPKILVVPSRHPLQVTVDPDLLNGGIIQDDHDGYRIQEPLQKLPLTPDDLLNRSARFRLRPSEIGSGLLQKTGITGGESQPPGQALQYPLDGRQGTVRALGPRLRRRGRRRAEEARLDPPGHGEGPTPGVGVGGFIRK